MNLKSIILLIVAILLLSSVAGMAAIDVEDRYNDEKWRWDARYWWEVPPMTPYEREQIKEIMVLVLNRYFGIDISAMSPEEFEEVGKLLGPERKWEALRLFGYYAQKRGFEVPPAGINVPPGFEIPPGIPAPIKTPAQENVHYWWEILDPEMTMTGIIYRVAQAKGTCPREVEERFEELFPGVDIWGMNCYEFDNFVNNLPRPPRKPVCFEELKDNPYVIAMFGRVPSFSTEEEMEKFNEKLNKVIEKARPYLDKLPHCEFPLGIIVAHRGAISIGVRSDQLPQAVVVYYILSEKAESLFGIKDVPVTFNNAIHDGPDICYINLQESLSSSTSPDWRPPWNESFNPIPGAVKIAGVTSHRISNSTASFAVQRRIWWWWDNDLIMTGHKFGITPVNLRIYQPTTPHDAGSVADNVSRRTRADAARVGIPDARVRPYILIGGNRSNPTLHPVLGSGDPINGSIIRISAGRTGLTWYVEVKRTRFNISPWGSFEMVYNTTLVRPWTRYRHQWTMGGDSGSPYWNPMWKAGVHGANINGLHMGRATIHGIHYMVMTPVSGVKHEFPGWRVWHR